jgi:filamentous hemagglutinin family protein
VFTTTTPTLQNVISRVSGSASSQINGLLALLPQNGGKPSFFLVNPAGVTFGAGAQIDVPGAFHVTTANRLKFADGTVLMAGEGPDSSLTIAAPEAFGFLGNRQVASLNFNNRDAGGNAGPRVNIALAPGSAFNVVGGAVEFASVGVSVPEGTLRVGATGDAAVDVPLNGFAGMLLAGAIEASDATLSTSGAGRFDLAGGAIVLRNGTAISANAGGVNVSARSLLVSGSNTSISTSTSGAAQGRSVRIAAQHMTVEQLASISAGTSGKGNAGDITMAGDTLAVLTGGRIEASTAGGERRLDRRHDHR